MAKFAAQVLFPGQIDPTVAATNPAEYPLRFLAAGDSWFSFGSWKQESLLGALELSRPAAVVTLAAPGDTLRRMSDVARNRPLDHWMSRRFGAYGWNAILVSGGGNDLIDLASSLVPASAAARSGGEPIEDYLDLARLDLVLESVREGFRRIVALRDRHDSPSPGVPLVTHDYDLVTPRDAPARFLVARLGPWLCPAMLAARIPPARWNEVSDYLLGALSRTLAGLEGELFNFHVVRTQGTLDRALPDTRGTSRDWANEIHPNGRGFRKLARLLAAPLEALT